MGCGTGTNVITLAQHGWRALGVDFALKAIAQGRGNIQQAGLQARATLQVGSVTDLRNIDGSFDLILDIGCYHGLPQPDRQAYLANLHRLLRPGGDWLLYTFLKRAANDTRGVDDAEIAAMVPRLQLTHRQDGQDGTRRRASSWMTLTRYTIGQEP